MQFSALFGARSPVFPSAYDANAGTKPATQTGLCGPQISALIRTFSADDFSCFFVQKITCKALKLPNSPCRAQTRQLLRFNRREKLWAAHDVASENNTGCRY